MAGALLVGLVALHAVVQLEHHVVVAAAARLGDVQRVQQRRTAGQGRLDARRKFARGVFEQVAYFPHALPAPGVHIAEHAQDAGAPVGPGRKGVNMQQGVVFAARQFALADIAGPVAGRRNLQFCGVSREQGANQGQRAAAEALDHHGQRHQLLLGSAGTPHAAGVGRAQGLVADVFVRARQPARFEKAFFAFQ